MRLQSKIVLVVAAVALLCFLGFSSKAQRSPRITWDYKLVTEYGSPQLPLPNPDQFKDLGAEGWELVTMRSEDIPLGNKRQVKLIYYFKRPS